MSEIEILGAAGSDADLIRLCEENLAAVKAFNRSTAEIDSNCDGSPLWDTYLRTQEAIVALPPQGLAGVVAKARLALGEAQEANPFDEESWEHGPAGSWARDVVHDLLRLYGRVALRQPIGASQASGTDGKLLALCARLEAQQRDVKRVAADPTAGDMIKLDVVLDAWWKTVVKIRATPA